MKTKLFLSVFLVLSVFFSAQNYNQQVIATSFTNFLNQLKNKQIDQVVESIYPKFFTATPELKKDQMKMILNMTYNNPVMKVEIKNFKVVGAGKPDLIQGEYFSTINYAVRIHFNAEGMNEKMRNTIKNMLVQKYGTGNVIYYPNEMSYYINAKMKACAVSKDQKIWKFVLIENEFKPRVTKVLPKKILDKL
ncbi:hypothetical protein SAMN05421796_102298 [Chryseobacterium piscicola]|uniref:Uncharacterized protein n=1 Tax=Chryseobacterium piscicola TaxID=551459 RepID=A0A1N7LGF3_9FLAO|nr:hypothetical protein [Chryseobacterium piscicola]PQA97607.1 hypothetical protein B0A70_02800 [Chryseobacterium piscicola]SIS72856.1 hypothetical protein SAMN05421796_102298 [Chryseobacterium piscicola]